MFKQTIVALCTVLVSSAAFASSGSTGADTLNYFVGDWQCHVQDAGGIADPNGFATASTERLRGDWFVTWILAFHDGSSSKKVSQMRYDEARSEYVLFVQSDEGCYGMATAKDWQGDELVFKGTMHGHDGKDFEFTKTFAKQDGGTFDLTWQAEGEKSEATMRCSK